MKILNYAIFILFLGLLSCGSEKVMAPPESGGECSNSGVKVCSESYIEVLQCGNDLEWHTIAICNTSLGQYCIEADGTAYCNGAGGTPDHDVDTTVVPDKDSVSNEDNSISDEDIVVHDEDEILDEDVEPQDFVDEEEDVDEQQDDDTPPEPYCGDGNVDEIYSDITKEYADNTQISVADKAVSESEITAPEDGTILSFSYKFHITHSRPADLTVEVISPDEDSYLVCSECTAVELQNRDETVTTFDGDSGMGLWQLKVTDSVLGNNGMIYYFRISLELHVFVNGEECDDANVITEKCPYDETACTVCDDTCHSVAGETATCGDGVTNAGDEVCDDGVNDGSYGHCNADCQSMADYCGDSTVTDAEMCDDGINDGTYGHCNIGCGSMAHYCGDLAVTDAEVCDDGINDGTYGHCNVDCLSMANYCGDSATTDAEVCDEGALNGTLDHCNADCSGVYTCEPTVWTFSYTGGQQTLDVPATGVYKVEVWGGQGRTNAGVTTGGLGGYSKADITLDGSDNLTIFVGQGGGKSIVGCWNGGGSAVTSGCAAASGGGGGGASDVRKNGTVLGDRIIIAGGGGGAGGNRVQGCGPGGGGAGGGGYYGGGGGGSYNPSTNATGGTQSSGGTGGLGQHGGGDGFPGVSGTGGNGGTVPTSSQSGSINGAAGGSGGGNTGSNGGYAGDWSGGSGAGGSGYVTASGNTNTSTTNGVRSGNGEIKITRICE